LGNAGIGSGVERRARAAPDGVAVIAGDRSLTYAELADRARRPKGELRAWCREHLAAYQVPAFVTFVGCLPRNSVGKLIPAELHNDAALAPPPPRLNRSGR